MVDLARSQAAPRSTLRRDAQANREQILNAAREIFAEFGIKAPMEQVATRAGVGVATLYRRFPARSDLIAGAFESKMRAYVEATKKALTNPDPWEGFTQLINEVCQMQALDHGFADVLTMTFPESTDIRESCDVVYNDLVEIVKRAKNTGRLRSDFVPEDVPLILVANAGVINATADSAPDVWIRFVALILQSLEIQNPAKIPKPMTRSQMQELLNRQ